MDVAFDYGPEYQPSFNDNYSGFPFDDDRNRTNIRSYLDDFANRHPEFADQLKEPTWSDDFVDSNFGRKRRGSGEEDPRSHPSGSGPSQSPKQTPTEADQPRPQNLNQFGLRNTVPLAQSVNNEEERRQRSMSAPPDNRNAEKAKRFVTKCEIPMQDPTQGKPPMPPKSAQDQTAQKGSNSPSVRLIPIQVEGRDEPVVNAKLDTSTNFGGEAFHEPSFEARLPRDFGTYQKHSPRFSQPERVPTPPQQPQQPPPQQQPQQQQPQPQPQPPPAPHTDETDSKPTKPEPPKDPISKVQVIQKEVEELMKQVENFDGKSRADKNYMILDELLTRKLISLDDIETEGKENVRQARKDTIRSIQRCISRLESKVPLGDKNKPNESKEKATEQGSEMNAESSEISQPMEVDQTKENTPVSVNEENQKMEVDAKETPENKVQQSNENC